MAIAKQHAGGAAVVRLAHDGGGGREGVLEIYVRETAPSAVRGGAAGRAVEEGVGATGAPVDEGKEVKLIARVEEGKKIEGIAERGGGETRSSGVIEGTPKTLDDGILPAVVLTASCDLDATR
jgi:hypothetical protein